MGLRVQMASCVAEWICVLPRNETAGKPSPSMYETAAARPRNTNSLMTGANSLRSIDRVLLKTEWFDRENAIPQPEYSSLHQISTPPVIPRHE